MPRCNIPFALIGAIPTLLISGIPLAVSAAIGFIALFGQAAVNGVVMVSYIKQLKRQSGFSGRPVAPAKSLLVGVCLLLGWGPAFAADAVVPEEVVAERRDGIYYASLSLQVPVPAALALEVLTDFDHMAEFVPNLTASRIVSHIGNVYRIAQQGKASFGPLGFRFESERQVEVLPDGRLLSKALSGSTKYMRSEMRVQGTGAASRVDYRIEMIPEHWAPTVVGVSFMRHELAEQFTALLREMERRQKAR